MIAKYTQNRAFNSEVHPRVVVPEMNNALDAADNWCALFTYLRTQLSQIIWFLFQLDCLLCGCLLLSVPIRTANRAASCTSRSRFVFAKPDIEIAPT
jgi:hypothetical protein